MSTGDSGKVRVYRTSDWAIAKEALLNGEMGGRKFEKSFAGALAISRDGKFLFVIDEGNWRVVVLNAESMEKSGWVGTGRYPFGLALSPDGSKLYVTNTGLFEYRTIPGVGEGRASAGWACGFRHLDIRQQAARRVRLSKNQHVPGLGDENSDEGSSLWTIDVRDPANPGVIGKLRLGDRISESRGETIGGGAPTGVAATEDAVYVALAHKDSVGEDQCRWQADSR